jgi:hypothetical protein
VNASWQPQVYGPGCVRCTLNPPRVQAKQSRCTTVRNSHYAILGRHAGRVPADMIRRLFDAGRTDIFQLARNVCNHLTYGVKQLHF